MSQENVEVARRYVESLGRFQAAYRANPGPLNETPFIDEFFECLDPEVEWRWPLSDEAFRGREAMLGAATDFLDAVDDWKIDVDEIVDAGSRSSSGRAIDRQRRRRSSISRSRRLRPAR